MNEMTETEMRSAFYKKKSALREEVLKLDWSKDGMLVLPGGRGYPYLSTDKIKKNLASLYPKVGLEFRASDKSVTPMDGVGNMTQHWVVECTFALIDVDTGYEDASTSFGEAADSGDKGVGKAKSHAFKRWAVAEFNLADGIDPDGTAVSDRFKPMTEEEEARFNEKLQERAVKPPAPKTVEAPKPKPTVEAPKPPAPKTVEAPKPADAPAQKYEPAPPQKQGIIKIVNALTEKKDAGTITAEEFDAMIAERDAIDSGQKATEFIMKYADKV